MTSGLRGLRALLRAAAARASRRQAEHARRLLRALLWVGPGRLPGEVLDVAVGDHELIVHGWVALPRRRPLAVLVTVTGAAAATGQLGLPTPRCADGQPVTTRSPNAGWRAVVPLDATAAGTLLVTAVGVFDSGFTEPLRSQVVDVVPPPPPPPPLPVPAGSIDHPADGAQIEGAVVWAHGWLRPDLDLVRLEVILGDGAPTRARAFVVPRPDIGATSPHPAAPLAGWHALLDVPPTVEHTETDLVVVAHGTEVTTEIARSSVRVGSRRPRPVQDPARVAALEARTAIAIGQRGSAAVGPALHILAVTHHLGLGGGQLYLQLLLRQMLLREDIRCTVMSSADGVLREELEELGAVVHVVGPAPSDGEAYESWLAGVAAFVVAAGVPGAIIANTAGSFWGVDLAGRLGRPSVWAIHESFTPEQFMAAGFSGAADEHVAGRFHHALAEASAVVFEADATAALYADAVGAGRRLRVDYGIDLDRIAKRRATDRAACRAELGFDETDVVLLGMGTFEPRKGQAAMALAFAAVAADHPEAVLALVGDVAGPYSEGLHEAVQRLGLGDRLRLVPITPDIDGWYHAADALLIGADIESLPMSMLEAMAFGRPIIAASVFGIPEVVHDGVEGILFEPLELPALERALRRFLGAPAAEREAMSQKAQEVAEGRPAHHCGDVFRGVVDVLIAGGKAEDLDESSGVRHV